MFLTAEWRWLAMLNYEVDPALLRDLVPDGTTLDRWNDKVFLSLVGFRFLDTKILGVPIPFHRNFDEVNLRFYVRREPCAEVRRGVVFIREIVPRLAIATVARMVYNENYVSFPMSHRLLESPNQRDVEYGWCTKHGQCKITLTAPGEPAVPPADSEEQFVTEHYWGYVKQRDGATVEYRVEHPPWKVWRAELSNFVGETEHLYGRELGAVLKGSPSSAFLAEGSPVIVHRGRRI